ncbi:class Ib ribonucleoside-diphosphate reductase assembly flavoprotein NrdI [Tetragenococcus koreensis]|uniref:Ribonucleotide reductase n=1 Tax=Tetragenococcus koreensis TaxID=290335 RepID=A0AAN4UBN0_9ENTE|nr:class Ib ribonucleoside-diphosphate reductase assembly flavoprotein NrdI [Tetragenococcus koreensis]AYW45461.1 ribonucleotide reductase assembly protein NrdI [Tetragenococcus koreensis]MCF1584055.1 class Ib ribonucleoside-diphosphate reductase assembly flavoprotein NrdI [Tetragenococcus koreensis]MCF1613516.1 class Ib ribonucleoside-diphosphate reductase assembly flavoprotein NrdI [Tetragenococcus koreensis]MCF1616751.1 class Ib ribonucleoside-diphosphate reductase assembly flavoprotein NrdI
MNVRYISISGNTRSFIQRLQRFAEEENEKNPNDLIIHAKEIDDNTPEEAETEPFFAFVPTYLEGGNGIDNGDQEILTESLRDYIEFENNADHCLGVIGSGNKNFNDQYCLTAKQYAEQFNTPFLADFELRGTNNELATIYQLLCEKWQAAVK